MRVGTRRFTSLAGILGLIMRLLVLYPVFLAGLVSLPSLMISMISNATAEQSNLTLPLVGSPNHHLNGIINKNRMLLRPHHNLGCKFIMEQTSLQRLDLCN